MTRMDFAVIVASERAKLEAELSPWQKRWLRVLATSQAQGKDLPTALMLADEMSHVWGEDQRCASCDVRRLSKAMEGRVCPAVMNGER